MLKLVFNNDTQMYMKCELKQCANENEIRDLTVSE